jgi:hypothetical protein
VPITVRLLMLRPATLRRRWYCLLGTAVVIS